MMSPAGRNIKGRSFIARVFQNPLLGTCPSATIEQNMALAIRRGLKRGLAPGVKSRDRLRFRRELRTPRPRP